MPLCFLFRYFLYFSICSAAGKTKNVLSKNTLYRAGINWDGSHLTRFSKLIQKDSKQGNTFDQVLQTTQTLPFLMTYQKSEIIYTSSFPVTYRNVFDTLSICFSFLRRFSTQKPMFSFTEILSKTDFSQKLAVIRLESNFSVSLANKTSTS